MSTTSAIKQSILRKSFLAFVAYAFSQTHDEKLGKQKYIERLCYVISRFIEGKTRRLIINLPPQHLKSFVGTVCLAAFLLGNNPRLRIIIVAYNDAFAEMLCGKVRDIMRSPWYRAIFRTRLKEGHSRSNDFATDEGGGVFAVSATGSVTGRTADVIFYDDPHEIFDWNNENKLRLVRENFNTIMSRLHDKERGRIIVIAHRVSDHDLSAFLLEETGWTFLRLPLMAVKTRTYELGHDQWIREKGELLRPDAYSRAEIERLQRTQVAPPFNLFYQQGVAHVSHAKIRAEDFGSFEKYEEPIAPVVLSIDPGHGGGPEASRSVIQAWKFFQDRHFLIDQFCNACDLKELVSAFWRFVRRYRPSVALIEKTADGPGLGALVRKAKFEIKVVKPRKESKPERLYPYRPLIRRGAVVLPAEVLWREEFVAEIVNFPAEYDDQVDAMTQYLDFMTERPALRMPEAHTIGQLGLYSHHPWRGR
jgi:predicted phage terminase large subunit-like protein